MTRGLLGMFGAWEGQEIAAFWTAISAVVISVFAIWYARREARAAEGALRLARRRELGGTVDLRFDDWRQEPISGIFAIENRGGTTVGRAEVEVISGDSVDVGFTDDNRTVQRSRTFARLVPGVPKQATIRLVDQALVKEGKLKVRATFATGKDEWSKLYELELPIYGPLMA